MANTKNKTKQDTINNFILGWGFSGIPRSEYIAHQIDAPHCIRVVQPPSGGYESLQFIRIDYKTFNNPQASKYYILDNNMPRPLMSRREADQIGEKNTLHITHYDRLQIQSVSMTDQSPQSILTTSKDIYIRYYNVKTVRTIGFIVAVPMDNEKYFDWDIALQEKYFKDLRADVAYHDKKKVYICESNRVYEVRIFAFSTSHNVTEVASASIQGILINYWRYDNKRLQKVWSGQ